MSVSGSQYTSAQQCGVGEACLEGARKTDELIRARFDAARKMVGISMADVVVVFAAHGISASIFQEDHVVKYNRRFMTKSTDHPHTLVMAAGRKAAPNFNVLHPS